jgi:DNA-binding transcriptional MerR regulator
MFSKSIFLENGKELLKRYNQKNYKRNNIPLYKIIIVLKDLGLPKKEILKVINSYKFKKSKGSTNSVKLPLTLDDRIIRLANFVRIRNGGITFSKSYINSFNENFDDIISTTKNIFQIEPTYTCKKEPIFCSGVLSEFFNYIIKSDRNDRLR